MNAKTQTTELTLNGVDLPGLQALMRNAEEQPALAEAQWRATNEWLDGPNNRTAMQGFFAAGEEDESRTEAFLAPADEPPVLLGENRGPNPVEYVLTALLGCLTTTLVYFAAAEGLELKSVRSKAEADMNVRGMFGIDPEVRNGFSDVRVSFEIESDEPRDRIEALMQTAKERSVVLDILSNPTPVSVELS